jgi:hypothetical protein
MRIEHKGNATSSTLDAGTSAGDLTITAVSLTNWPDGSVGEFYGAIEKGRATEEKIRFSGRTGNTLSVAARGVDDTTAQSHPINASIEHIWTAVEADEANIHVNTVHTSLYYQTSAPSAVTVGVLWVDSNSEA